MRNLILSLITLISLIGCSKTPATPPCVVNTETLYIGNELVGGCYHNTVDDSGSFKIIAFDGSISQNADDTAHKAELKTLAAAYQLRADKVLYFTSVRSTDARRALALEAMQELSITVYDTHALYPDLAFWVSYVARETYMNEAIKNELEALP